MLVKRLGYSHCEELLSGRITFPPSIKDASAPNNIIGDKAEKFRPRAIYGWRIYLSAPALFPSAFSETARAAPSPKATLGAIFAKVLGCRHA